VTFTAELLEREVCMQVAGVHTGVSGAVTVRAALAL